jgi:AraC family transcriptional regulator
MQTAVAGKVFPLVPSEWLHRMPSQPLLSSETLGWKRISALRVCFPDEFQLDLPPVRGPYISAHLRNPCELSARWNGRERRCRSIPGETIIMNPHQENTWAGAGAIDELQMFLDPVLIQEAAAEVTDREVHLLEGIGIRDPMISALAARMVDELANPGPCSGMLGTSIAMSLAMQLLSRHSTLRPAAKIARIDMPPHKVRAAVEFIETHLAEELSVESIAEAIGMSPFRFARGFAKGTGLSPHQFLLNRRIEHSKDLLQSSNREIVDIARATGFASQSHFTSVFRRRCQVTPLAYRRGVRRN